MTREELKEHCKKEIEMCEAWAEARGENPCDNKVYEEHELILELLEQKPCEDAISRQELDKALYEHFHEEDSPNNITDVRLGAVRNFVKNFPPVILQSKIGHCKDCKWWKDSNGFFRRGRRDDICPINRREVFEGNGYCYLFEPKMEVESEERV